MTTHLRNSFFVLSVATLIGCGGTDPSPEATPAATDTSAAQPAAGTPASAEADRQAAMKVVGQFLDRIRRGGQTAQADQLLTAPARAEFEKLGGFQDALGAPNASFSVTRAEFTPPVDGQPERSSMLVQSIWSEPGGNGASADTSSSGNQMEVLWAVQKELGQWRISGTIMQMAADQPPTVIDFENPQQMAKIYAGTSSGPRGQAPSQGQSVAGRQNSPTEGSDRR